MLSSYIFALLIAFLHKKKKGKLKFMSESREDLLHNFCYECSTLILFLFSPLDLFGFSILLCLSQVRFVVMGNMFYTELRIHRRYDLKGSSYGRYTDKGKMNQNATLKDLDLSYEFYMDRSLRDALFK